NRSDSIALMNDGRLVQYDAPEAILARPRDAFVDESVGSDRALKRLALIPAAEVMPAGVGAGDARPRIAVDAGARDVLSAMLAAGADSVTLIDENGAPRGTITLAAMRTRLSARDDGSAGGLRPSPIH